MIKKLLGCICFTILCLPGVVAYGEQEPEPANHDALSLDLDTLEEELVAPVAAEELLEPDDEGINRERLRSRTALLGGVYYQMARKSGYGQGGSLLYSALMSTFFWEYGVEAFAERPSIQDLLITPLAGWAVGEWFHRTEKKIIANQNRFMGSEIIGEIALFFMDPMSRIGNGVNRLVGQEWVLTGSLAPHSPYASGALRGDHPDGIRSQSPMLTLALQRQF